MNKRDLQELSGLRLSDQDLVQQVKNGDKKSFSELVHRHQKGLLYLCLRFMKDIDHARDITQEAFIKAYEKIHGFEERSSFKSWIYQIAINTARNKLRETKRTTIDIDQIQIAVESHFDEDIAKEELSIYLQNQVNQLPHKQKTALILRVYEDLSFHEISQIMSCPYDTAKANYRHAIMKLRKTLSHRSEMQAWVSDVGSFFNELSMTQEAEA